MQLVRGVIAGILLFLGRELNFLFAAATAAWIALRITPLLPGQWPAWADYAFIGGFAVVVALLVLLNERAGYFISGFFAGAAFLEEYFTPGTLALPLLPFIVGGVIGALIIGLFTEWALILVSCLAGAYYVTTLFKLTYTAQILVGAGLFIIGALTQVILMRMQKD